MTLTRNFATQNGGTTRLAQRMHSFSVFTHLRTIAPVTHFPAHTCKNTRVYPSPLAKSFIFKDIIFGARGGPRGAAAAPGWRPPAWPHRGRRRRRSRTGTRLAAPRTRPRGHAARGPRRRPSRASTIARAFPARRARPPVRRPVRSAQADRAEGSTTLSPATKESDHHSFPGRTQLSSDEVVRRVSPGVFPMGPICAGGFSFGSR